MSRNENVRDFRFYNELPYEKYEKYGVSSLSDQELLACILRSGIKNFDVFEIVNQIFCLSKIKADGLSGILKLTKKDLLEVNGIGRVKSSQLLCIVELMKRVRMQSVDVKEPFINPFFVSEYYMDKLRGLDRECVIEIFLNTKQQRISDKTISIGSLNASILNPREVFKDALAENAASIILMHNHPSGDPRPSDEDIHITRTINEGGKLIGIPLVDHIIIGNNTFYSLRESGYFGRN